MPSDETRIIIFRNRVRSDVADEYGARAGQIFELAEKMPGFVSSSDFTAEDGERLAIIEFDSPEHLAAWRKHAEHRAAQGEGRARWYEAYSLQICAVLRESRFDASTDAPALPAIEEQRPFERVQGEGGCACGRIRYRVSGRPVVAALCHCGDCRRACGATPVAWAAFHRTKVEWLTEPPKERASSARAFRSFCPDCGSQIGFRYPSEPDYVDITIATLDDPDAVAPRDHLWIRSKVAWVHLRDELVRHDRDFVLPPAPTS
ncbi:MAG: hypothetical protein HOW73_40750 [Polyangiaceae bacterium]|nr:hypothetical protein [Polyangiaceae bacterium]